MEQEVKENKLESLKELDDTEFEIMFIDSIYKKLKSLDKPGMSTNTMLFMYMSVIESLKRYKDLAKEDSRTIPHEDVVNTLILKGESYLQSVANDSERAKYSSIESNSLLDLTKDLLILLKSELVNSPKYSYLKPAEIA